MCNDTDCACYDGAAYARIAKLELDSEHYEMLCQTEIGMLRATREQAERERDEAQASYWAKTAALEDEIKELRRALDEAPKVGDLAMLVGRLARVVRSANTNSELAASALDYLKQHHLTGCGVNYER